MDHRLRTDSATDATYVRRLAERLGLPFHLAVAVDEPGRSDSVEMWGRFERAREAGRVARAIGATRMADGHTLDDQAETILMGLVLGWDGRDRSRQRHARSTADRRHAEGGRRVLSSAARAPATRSDEQGYEPAA